MRRASTKPTTKTATKAKFAPGGRASQQATRTGGEFNAYLKFNCVITSSLPRQIDGQQSHSSLDIFLGHQGDDDIKGFTHSQGWSLVSGLTSHGPVRSLSPFVVKQHCTDITGPGMLPSLRMTSVSLRPSSLEMPRTPGLSLRSDVSKQGLNHANRDHFRCLNGTPLIRGR